MIRVSELTKNYGSRVAIDRISFDAKHGEILGFLGPNGAGKTTTMRILTSYMPPTSGKVEIGGFDVVEQSLEVRKIVGYLPETVPLYPDMTVSEYLQYMGSLHHVANLSPRVEEVLKMVSLQDRARGYVSNLSKGMRQRLGLAQALIHRPKILILDEPTIGLDPAQIIEVRNLIRELGSSCTILLSTHILSEAQQVCNRVLIINKGHIVAEDTPQRLQARLTGAGRVLLRVLGNPEDAISPIATVPGVTNITIKSQDTIEFETAPGQEARPLVTRALVAANINLLEMKSAALSLEEIFLELTRDEPIAPVIGQPDEPDSAQEA